MICQCVYSAHGHGQEKPCPQPVAGDYRNANGKTIQASFYGPLEKYQLCEKCRQTYMAYERKNTSSTHWDWTPIDMANIRAMIFGERRK